MLWPWGVERTENDFNTHSPNNKGMAVIAQRLAYHNNYSSQQLLSYNTEGTTKDAFYGYLGAPSYTVEMGRSFYEDCGVFARETYPENFNGFHYLSRVLYRPYQLPFGPDTVNVKVGAATVQAGDKVAVSRRPSTTTATATRTPARPTSCRRRIRWSTTSRRPRRMSTSCPGKPGAVGIDMTLVDLRPGQGPTIPDATKTATGSIDTTGLAAGEHMVYVQGTNADGKAGAVSAQFLTVTAAPRCRRRPTAAAVRSASPTWLFALLARARASLPPSRAPRPEPRRRANATSSSSIGARADAAPVSASKGCPHEI